MENNSQGSQWKEKVKSLMGLCHKEFNRTKEMGAQMLNASRINSELNLNFQRLGNDLYEKIKDGIVTVDNEEIMSFIEKIDRLKEKLRHHEEEVKRIKHSKE